MSKKHYSKDCGCHHSSSSDSSCSSSVSSTTPCCCCPPPPPCTPKVYSRTLPECSNVPVKPYITPGPVIAKLPVLITDTRIQIDIEASITLPEEAFEIKRIRKNVFLTQCRLIPEYGDKHYGKLFLGGFIRKNIEYATAAEAGCGAVSGSIKHTTVDVQFECVTKVSYINRPIIKYREPADQIEYYEANILGACDPCKSPLLGTDLCQQDFFDNEKWTEKIFCELDDAKICEADIERCPQFFANGLPGQRTFTELTEKVVVLLSLKLLQYQQVWIPPYYPTESSSCSNSGYNSSSSSTDCSSSSDSSSYSDCSSSSSSSSSCGCPCKFR